MTGKQPHRTPRPNHSTGPTTPEGKRRCRLDAYRHGLTGQLCVFTPEEQQAYERHCNVVHEALAPVGDFERDLAQSIADDGWRLKRARAIEASTFALGTHDHPADNTGAGAPEVMESVFSSTEVARELSRARLLNNTEIYDFRGTLPKKGRPEQPIEKWLFPDRHGARRSYDRKTNNRAVCFGPPKTKAREGDEPTISPDV